MSDAEIAWWAWFWGEVEHWAFLGVVLTLAIEFAALKFGAPYREQLEHAKDLRIAELARQTQEANARAAEANLALERFKAPRALSDRQAEILKEDLAQFSGTAVDILSFDDTLEVIRLQAQLAAVLKNAGWHVRSAQFSSSGWAATGAMVMVKEGSSADIEKAASALITELNKAGIFCERSALPEPWRTSWNISIGGIVRGDPMSGPLNTVPIRMIVGTKPPT